MSYVFTPLPEVLVSLTLPTDGVSDAKDAASVSVPFEALGKAVVNLQLKTLASGTGRNRQRWHPHCLHNCGFSINATAYGGFNTATYAVGAIRPGAAAGGYAFEVELDLPEASVLGVVRVFYIGGVIGARLDLFRIDTAATNLVGVDNVPTALLLGSTVASSPGGTGATGQRYYQIDGLSHTVLRSRYRYIAQVAGQDSTQPAVWYACETSTTGDIDQGAG